MPGLAIIFQVIVPTLTLATLVWILVELRGVRRAVSRETASRDSTPSQP